MRATFALRARVIATGGILTRLSASTRHLHADVDAHWLNLLRPDVGVSDYAAVLTRVYGLVAPFESACKYTPGLERVIDVRHVMRAGYIAQDLLALEVTPAQLSTIETCPSISIFRSVPEAIGWLYVIERSLLLQEGVSAHLIRRLPEVRAACNYLSSFDGRASEQWTAFGRTLERAVSTPKAADEVVEAARAAFATAKQWFARKRSHLKSVG